MTVREFIKPNRNGAIAVTIHDKLEVLACPSLNDATIVPILDREVKYWAVDPYITNADLPGLSIFLKEVDNDSSRVETNLNTVG